MSTQGTPPAKNPCKSCGACCAAYRVVFYWREVEKNPDHQVPANLTEDVDDFRKGMKGTCQNKEIRCTALKGRVGTHVWCGIYEQRPSPCRNFRPSYVNGDGPHNKRCDEARQSHGLKPLRPEDW